VENIQSYSFAFQFAFIYHFLYYLNIES